MYTISQKNESWIWLTSDLFCLIASLMLLSTLLSVLRIPSSLMTTKTGHERLVQLQCLPNSIFVLRSPWIFFPNVGLCSDCPLKSCPEGPSALSPASVRENCAPSPQGAVLMYRWNVTSGLTPSFPDGISLSMVWSGFCLYSANCLYMNLHGKKKWESVISDQVEKLKHSGVST